MRLDLPQGTVGPWEKQPLLLARCGKGGVGKAPKPTETVVDNMFLGIYAV